MRMNTTLDFPLFHTFILIFNPLWKCRVSVDHLTFHATPRCKGFMIPGAAQHHLIVSLVLCVTDYWYIIEIKTEILLIALTSA